jgi:hypothetical protein
VLVARREGPLLAGLWEPPGVDLTDGQSAKRPLTRALRRLGIAASLEPTGHLLRQVITHRAIAVEVWSGTLRGPLARAPGLRTVGPSRDRLPLSALGRRVLALEARADSRNRSRARRSGSPSTARKR